MTTMADIETRLRPFAEGTALLTDWTFVPSGPDGLGATLPDRAVWQATPAPANPLVIESWPIIDVMRVVIEDGTNFDFPSDSIPGVVVGRLVG